MHDAQNPRELALLVLDEIYERGAYANLALNKALRGNGLSSLDRKLCTELVYGTVKTTGTLDWYLCRVINRPFRKMAPRLRTILRMGLIRSFISNVSQIRPLSMSVPTWPVIM